GPRPHHLGQRLAASALAKGQAHGQRRRIARAALSLCRRRCFSSAEDPGRQSRPPARLCVRRDSMAMTETRPAIDHEKAEEGIVAFSYAKPEQGYKHGKAMAALGRSDILKSVVQVLREGGENALH